MLQECLVDVESWRQNESRLCELPACDQAAERQLEKQLEDCEEEEDVDEKAQCIEHANDDYNSEIEVCALPICKRPAKRVADQAEKICYLTKEWFNQS